MKKPTGKQPKPVGDYSLREVPYKDEWRVDIAARNPRDHKTRLNWREAEKYANEETAKRNAAKEKGQGRGYTFNDAADSLMAKWKKEVAAGAKFNSTHDGYLSLMRNHALPKFGRMRLAGIKTKLVNEWLLDMAAEGAAHDTLQDRLRVVRLVLNHAAIEEMIEVSPLKVAAAKNPVPFSQRAEIPDRSALEGLREYINGPRPEQNSRITWSCRRVISVLGASCGLRAEEQAGLVWDAIDPDTGEIEIRQVLTRKDGVHRPKSNRSYRKVPTTPAVRQQILEEHAIIYRKLYGKCVGFVLRTDEREFMYEDVVSIYFTQTMKKAGLVNKDGKTKFSLHGCRHWCASHWLKSTAGDIQLTAKWMGHSAEVCLARYAHCLDNPDDREKFERMPDWLVPRIQLEAPSEYADEVPRALPAPAPAEPAAINGTPTIDVVADAKSECPIYVPAYAEPWLRPWFEDLWRHGHLPTAYKAIAKNGRQVAPELRRLGLPKAEVLQEMACGVRAVPETLTHGDDVGPSGDCPIDLPISAPAWLRMFIAHIDNGASFTEACFRVRKDMHAVRDTLQALGLPSGGELRRQLRDRKIMQLAALGIQNSDIADKVGCDRGTVWQVRDMHKLTAAEVPGNPLKSQPKSVCAETAETQARHKDQLKLL